MTLSKNNKLVRHINYRVRVTLQDSRTFIGTFKSYDKHMNMILGSCEEFRKVKPKNSKVEQEEKRVLGFVLLRGDSIVSVTIEGPPVPKEGLPSLPTPGAAPGLGVGRAAGRGIPTGVGGVLVGLPGPSQQVMIPGGHGQAPALPQMQPGPFQMVGPPPRMMGLPPRMMVEQPAMGMGRGRPPPPFGIRGPPPGMMRGARPGTPKPF
ncbi:hypothetical protein FQR65_LT11086 [Abscondita terminalis]|nr:hypothetical protein FQR65_LT11086 [Abscondita terminalis]